MRVQCSGCGRYRVEGIWTRLDSAPVADFLGFCGPCGLMFKRRARREWAAGVRRTIRRGRHQEPYPAGLIPADVFEGMRHEDCDCMSCRPWTS